MADRVASRVRRELSAINATLQPILVRRTKTEVLKQLPERLDKTFFVPMTPQQTDHHEENREIVAKLVAKWRRHRFLSELDQRRLTIALQRMRMACNSTYLLDQKTDFGLKCEELMALLEEMFEQPETKVIIFSQWLRTHELIEQRLEQRRWDRVLFHGGVPGKERKNLVRRFKEDPDCRLFLATDAGGVGLNLQNASVVVNMDQPWNPAVLEQRIGRAHRLGQHRPVRVVNFVAQGTIEHSMLSLLSFKRSVFAGALDGGSDEVFLGGTRLSKFMESVEQTTGAIPAPMPPTTGEAGEAQATPSAEEIAKETAAEERAAQAAAPDKKSPPPQDQVWTDVAAAGLTLLEKLSQALAQPATGGKEDMAQTPPAVQAIDALIHQDPASGERYLRLPVPAVDVLQKAVDLLSAFATMAKK